MWEHELPSVPFTFGLSWQYSAPRTALLCTPHHYVLHSRPHSFAAFYLCHQELLFFGRSWRKKLGAAPRLGKESWFRVSLESKQVLKAPEPHSRATIVPCCTLSPPHPWSAKTSISVPAITMTRVIRDSYCSAQNRFEAEPLPCTPPPHICRSSSRHCTGTQQLGLQDSKDDRSGFRSL